MLNKNIFSKLLLVSVCHFVFEYRAHWIMTSGQSILLVMLPSLIRGRVESYTGFDAWGTGFVIWLVGCIEPVKTFEISSPILGVGVLDSLPGDPVVLYLVVVVVCGLLLCADVVFRVSDLSVVEWIFS